MPQSSRGAVWLLLISLIFAPLVLSVKEKDFKTCSQSGFCRRGRALADRARDAGTSWTSPYSIVDASIAVSDDKAAAVASVKSSLYPDIKFSLELRVHEDGVVRVRMDEVDGLRKRYDEAASWALISEPVISQNVKWVKGKKDLRAAYGEKKEKIELVVQYEPLRVTLLRGGKEQVVLNGQGLLHMEHFRTKQVESTDEQVVLSEDKSSRSWFEGDNEDAYWDESFGSWTDTKPKGPESLSIDITFPNHGTLYGIPQHATRLALPTTGSASDATFSDPYRLWNSDVFEYLASSPMSLYGSIPILHAQSTESLVGVFNAIGSDTWIDVAHSSPKSSQTHWVSESGILDIFLLPGPTPEDVFRQYAGLTGPVALPAQWSLGYHQCRWNYVSSDDVRSVQKRFDEEDIPVDVFWLDIEYAEEHKYFMWDKKNFPDPVEMTNDVAANGRKMVVIVDPHLKRANDYPVYREASELELMIKQKDGKTEYEGWCWSGSSAWLDMFNPNVWDWWKSLFIFDPNAKKISKWSWLQSTEAVHLWNDMNEPAIFNGPEVSMPRDSIHYGGWEHRDLHNINGMLFHNLSSQAVSQRTDPAQRPFVLTRSFFAGSQRFGAMWTGDNLGTWDHMTVGLKMVLANNIAGMSYSGSDVGGFFGNPDTEMLVRWYQLGIFNPFFRAHAHIDTKRREPYLLEEPYKSMLRDILRLRYAMLPVWYTAFRESSVTGLPVVRPHYVVFPHDQAGFTLDDQFFVGSSGLLIKPVTVKGAKDTTVYLPADQVFYDYFNNDVYRGQGKEISVTAELDQIPVFIRGGSIVSTRERPRRSSPLMKYDPFTLRVALDKTGSARGELYLDDGETFQHESGEFIWREFTAEKKTRNKIVLESKDLAAKKPNEAVYGVLLDGKYKTDNRFVGDMAGVRVEKVVVVGLDKKPSSVSVDGQDLAFEYEAGLGHADKKDGKSGVLTIKDPAVKIYDDWTLTISL